MLVPPLACAIYIRIIIMSYIDVGMAVCGNVLADPDPEANEGQECTKSDAEVLTLEKLCCTSSNITAAPKST